MAKVKGTVLIDFIKTIKSDKSGAYDRFLTDSDREILSQRVLPSGWYPYETFVNCFKGAAAVLANNNMDTVRQWGRLYGEAIIKDVYSNIVKDGRPMDSLKKYRTYIRNVFDFGEFEVTPVSDNEALITIKGMDPCFEAQYYMMLGWVERSLELCGAADIKVEFLKKSWEGEPETSIKLAWS